MAKATSEQVDDQATSTGALEIPAEPDSSPQSITAGILAELGDEPLVKKKPGRPKKQTLADVLDDDADLPAAEVVDEPADDEPDQPEPKDGNDEPDEPTELEDQLAALAEESGVDPQLLEGMGSVDEANRFVERMYQVFYREGAANDQNGHAEHREPPAPNGVQTKAADALEIDLSKYDEDEPIRADLQKLIDRDKRRETELAELKAEKDRAREHEFQRVQQDVAYQFQNEFFTISPELFGTDKKQDPRQAQRMRKAFAVADTMIRGFASRRQQLPPVKAIARYAVNAEFAEDLTKQQLLSKRAKVQEREKRRSVGAPARVSRGVGTKQSDKVFEGPMEKDPDILAAVSAIHNRNRA